MATSYHVLCAYLHFLFLLHSGKEMGEVYMSV